MQLELGRHASDEALEQYSTGCLDTRQLQEFEEHLLICPRCQDRLALTDAYRKACGASSWSWSRKPPLRYVARIPASGVSLNQPRVAESYSRRRQKSQTESRADLSPQTHSRDANRPGTAEVGCTLSVAAKAATPSSIAKSPGADLLG